jgi:hypothetical protein
LCPLSIVSIYCQPPRILQWLSIQCIRRLWNGLLSLPSTKASTPFPPSSYFPSFLPSFPFIPFNRFKFSTFQK